MTIFSFCTDRELYTLLIKYDKLMEEMRKPKNISFYERNPEAFRKLHDNVIDIKRTIRTRNRNPRYIYPLYINQFKQGNEHYVKTCHYPYFPDELFEDGGGPLYAFRTPKGWITYDKKN